MRPGVPTRVTSHAPPSKPFPKLAPCVAGWIYTWLRRHGYREQCWTAPSRRFCHEYPPVLTWLARDCRRQLARNALCCTKCVSRAASAGTSENAAELGSCPARYATTRFHDTCDEFRCARCCDECSKTTKNILHKFSNEIKLLARPSITAPRLRRTQSTVSRRAQRESYQITVDSRYRAPVVTQARARAHACRKRE